MSEHWKSKGRYAAAILDLQKQVKTETKVAIDSTPCFGWLWKFPGETTECPETRCELRKQCQSVWNHVQTQIAQAVRKPRSENTRRPYRKYDKWRYDSKYTRRGWKSTGKPIDLLVETWDRIFYTVPKTEKYTFSKDEVKPVMKVTASYRALVLERTVVARMWTNANTQATIDVVPELVTPLVKLSNEIGKAEVTLPFPIPEKLHNKLKPCRHRVTVFTPFGAGEVALTIRKALIDKDLK